MHWRYTSNNVSLLGIDGVAFFPFIIWLFIPNKVGAFAFFLFSLMGLLMFLSIYANKKGMTLIVFMKKMIYKLGYVFASRKIQWRRDYESSNYWYLSSDLKIKK